MKTVWVVMMWGKPESIWTADGLAEIELERRIRRHSLTQFCQEEEARAIFSIVELELNKQSNG